MQEIDGVGLESFCGLKMMDYVHPHEVVQDDRLSMMEKRTLLCAWASDACAVESRPGFRWLQGTPGPILVDHIRMALRALDELAGGSRYAAYDAISDHKVFTRSAGPCGTAGAITG